MSIRKPDARKWSIGVINGPNMKVIGGRDPEVFGAITSLAKLEEIINDFAAEIGVATTCVAYDSEVEIIDFVRGSSYDGFLINPAGLTTYGDSTRDALVDSGKPYVEVHFANLEVWFANMFPREHVTSRFTLTATGMTMGLREHGYVSAVLGLVLALDDPYFLGKTAAPV